MKDFKKKNLYNNEIGLFEAVIKDRVETLKEYNQSGKFRVGNEEDDEIQTTVNSTLDWGSFDSGDSSWGMDDSWGSGFSAWDNQSANNDKALPNNEWTQLVGLNKFLYALYWSVMYTYRGILYDNPWFAPDEEDGDKHKHTLIAFSYTLLIIGVLSIVASFTPLTLLVHPVMGFLCLGLGAYTDWVNNKRYKTGLFKIALERIGKDIDEDADDMGDAELLTNDDDFGGAFGDDDFGSFDDAAFGGGRSSKGNKFDSFGDFGGFDGFDDGLSDLASRYDTFEDDDEGDFDPESSTSSDIVLKFPNSPVNTKGSEVDFSNGMLDVFRDANKYKGVMYHSRGDIVKSFAEYLPSNDSSFANWYEIKEHSPEYDNVAFTIYKALVQIDGKFDISRGTKDKLTILSMKRTPLIYKVEVKIPPYFKEKAVIGAAKIFESYLKMNDKDRKVGCLISTFGGNYVFKFLRLDYKGLISHGDIMRYSDPESGEATIDKMTVNNGVPILVGMENNEYPYVFDLEENTSGAIVGGSGSGKSWLTFQLMGSMLTSNSPEELNFLIMDAKNAPIWKQFAKAPHVLGYHTDIYKFLTLLQEVEQEHLRRAGELSRLGIENYKGLRKHYKKIGDWESLAKAPFLVVVIDEITYTMSTLAKEDKELHDEVKAKLVSLSTVVRSSGIRLLLIGQRAIDSSIPKSYMSSASLRFAMKMEQESEFGIMLGDDYKKQSRIPASAGEGLIRAAGSNDIYYIKTLIPAGISDETLLTSIRLISLDWVRRTIGTDIDYYQPPIDMRTTFKESFNRHDFYSSSIKLLEEGRILSDLEINEGYQVNINPGQTGTQGMQAPPPKPLVSNTSTPVKEEPKDIVDEGIDSVFSDDDVDSMFEGVDLLFDESFDVEFSSEAEDEVIPTLDEIDFDNFTFSDDDIDFSNTTGWVDTQMDFSKASDLVEDESDDDIVINLDDGDTIDELFNFSSFGDGSDSDDGLGSVNGLIFNESFDVDFRDPDAEFAFDSVPDYNDPEFDITFEDGPALPNHNSVYLDDSGYTLDELFEDDIPDSIKVQEDIDVSLESFGFEIVDDDTTGQDFSASIWDDYDEDISLEDLMGMSTSTNSSNTYLDDDMFSLDAFGFNIVDEDTPDDFSGDDLGLGSVFSLQDTDDELAKKQKEELAKKQAEELAKKQKEELAKKQAEELAKKQKEELAKKQAEELAKKQAEELAKKQAEELAKKQAEELAKKQAEELAKKQAEELAKQKALLKKQQEEALAEIEAQKEALKKQQEELERQKKQVQSNNDPVDDAPKIVPQKRKRPKAIKPQVEPNPTKNKQVSNATNLSVKQYIISYGVSVDSYTSSVNKEVLAGIFPPKEIKAALRMGDIYSQGDDYVAQLI